jgi:hypothetical protein
MRRVGHTAIDGSRSSRLDSHSNHAGSIGIERRQGRFGLCDRISELLQSGLRDHCLFLQIRKFASFGLVDFSGKARRMMPIQIVVWDRGNTDCKVNAGCKV